MGFFHYHIILFFESTDYIFYPVRSFFYKIHAIFIITIIIVNHLKISYVHDRKDNIFSQHSALRSLAFLAYSKKSISLFSLHVISDNERKITKGT